MEFLIPFGNIIDNTDRFVLQFYNLRKRRMIIASPQCTTTTQQPHIRE